MVVVVFDAHAREDHYLPSPKARVVGGGSARDRLELGKWQDLGHVASVPNQPFTMCERR